MDSFISFWAHIKACLERPPDLLFLNIMNNI